MDLMIERIDGGAVVSLHGDHLDMGNVEAFTGDITPILESNRRVLIDLTRVQFVDSAGLGALMACRRRLSAEGGSLTLYGLTRRVRSVFELSRMHRLFDIAETKEEALHALDPASAPETPPL
jgi:anti-sigma B factor antagonist